MRIAQIEKQRKWSGQTKQGFLIADAMRKRGHKALVVCQPGSAIGEHAAEAGIEVLYLPMRGWRVFTSAIRLAWRLWWKPCDILHAHGGRDHVLAVLADLLAPGAKIIRTKHNLTRIRRGTHYRHLTHKLIAVSDAARKVLLKAGVKEDKIRKINDGIDLAPFKPAEANAATLRELGIGADDFVIGATGRLGSKSKGIPDLLRAAPIVLEQAPHARFLLVGRSEPFIEELAESLKLGDRVIFTGFRTDVPQMLACMHLYVQPSIRDAFPSSLLEAMAMGKPVVATHVGGIPEAVLSGETGLLCMPRDPRDLAHTLLRLIGKPATLREMGRRARERALSVFDVTRMADQLEQTYRAVIRGR